MGTLFAISDVLRRLQGRSMEETIQSLGVKEEVRYLLLSLEQTKQLFVDVARKQQYTSLTSNDAYDAFRENIRKIFYEVEDVLEYYTLKVTSSRRMTERKRRWWWWCWCWCWWTGGCNRQICIFLELVPQRKVAAVRITTLNERIEFFVREYNRINDMYGIRVEGESSMAGHQRFQTSYFLWEEGTVGLEEEREKIISLLFNEDKKHPVTAIWGMGGSGKTKLAHLVFKDARIRALFDRIAWVSVGHKCLPISVFRRVLEQLMAEPSEEEIMQCEDIILAQKLSQVLKSKKCLIVLDDLWSSEALETLHSALAYQRTDSRVLVTTQNLHLVRPMAGRNYVHEMRSLSIDESWVLFMKRAFRNGDPDVEDVHAIETMGKDIVRKCGGLPFAVANLGNLFRTKPLSEWKILHANIDQCFERSSDIMKVLSWSYKDLPHYLKPCFLYLGYLLEDSEIEADKLYLLWMAEGIISLGVEKETVMEIGSSYLDELAARSMVYVQVDEVPTIRIFKSCRLHDLIRKLCLAEGKVDNFFEVIDLRHSNVLSQNCCFPFLTRMTRRLAVYLDKYEDGYPIHLKEKISQVMETADRLRSLLFLNASHDEQYMLWPEEIFNLKKFRLLRILDFDGFRFQTRMLPKGIEKLVNLTYLSLRGCYLEELQSCIGNLLNLQTLDLRVATLCKMTIPNILWKLEKLRHLYLPVAFQAKGDDKLCFAALRELQILENFDTTVCHAQHLLELTNIRILNARTSGNSEDLKAIMALLNKTSKYVCLSSLDIRNFDCYSEEQCSIVAELFICSSLCSLRIDGHIRKLPQINSSGLTKLSFSCSELLEDPMAILEKLPNLWVLVLCDAAYVGKVIVCPASGFYELRRLELSGLHNLERLTIEEGAMPNLTTLAIERCNSLEVPLDGLRFLAKLQELKIARMPIEFEDGLRQVQEELYKVHQGLAIKFLDDNHKE